MRHLLGYSLMLMAFGQAVLAQLPRNVPELGLSYPFVSHDFENDNYAIGGATILSSNKVRLTADAPDQRGWIYSRSSSLPRNFELSIDFKIGGQNKALYGDGMAFWFLKDASKIKEGSMFGLDEYYDGTSLVIDTYRNNRPNKAFPYMVLMQNNGQVEYDAEHDGRNNELAGHSLRGLRSAAGTHTLKVTYHEGGHFVAEVYYRERWETVIKRRLDLEQASTLAISAATGELHESHEIFKIQVTELPEWEEPVADVVPDESVFRWTFYFFVLIAVLGVVGICMVFRDYRKFKRNQDTLPRY